MLKNISVSHYKAFEKASIDIKPITILLGANSVGKSSIVQLFLMLQQTGKAGLKSYKSALKLYGGYINMGDPANLFRKRDLSKPVTITLNVKSAEIRTYLQTELFASYVRLFTMLAMYFPIKGFADLRNKEFHTRAEFSKFLDAILDVINKSGIRSTYRDEISVFIGQRISLPLPRLEKENRKEFMEAYDFLSDLGNKIRSDDFNISYQLKLGSESNLEIASVSISQGDLLLVQLGRNPNLIVKSDIVKITENVEKEIDKLFFADSTIFSVFSLSEDKLKSASLKTNVLIQVLVQFQNEIRKEFSEDSINYVSPLRAHPKRYYMLDKAKVNLTLDTLDGDAIAEVLKDDKAVTKNVNAWLKNFGVQVDVQGFKEVIHHLIVKQNNIDLDITDVGFGISQILPVIIQGFLSSRNSTTIIEQPEIHLHPKMQADLADLFIDMVTKSKGKKLIVETHSEYLLKRLRRRISEGVISPDDVAICLFNPQSEECGATINILPIAEKGFFEWPIDFYGGEILLDTTEYLKNQSN